MADWRGGSEGWIRNNGTRYPRPERRPTTPRNGHLDSNRRESSRNRSSVNAAGPTRNMTVYRAQISDELCVPDETENWDDEVSNANLVQIRPNATRLVPDPEPEINCVRDDVGNWDDDDALATTTNRFADLGVLEAQGQLPKEKQKSGCPAPQLSSWIGQAGRGNGGVLCNMSYSPSISLTSGASTSRNSEPRLLENDDKAYVREYQKEMDDVIEMVSKKPERMQPLNHRPSHQSHKQRSDESRISSLIGSKDHGKFNDADFVWDNIDMTYRLESTKKLAIYDQKEIILGTLNSHQVTIIEGYTGCGKTTQIPQYILDTHAETKRRCNIVVTQPRRIAAQSVAERVCKERNWNLGDLVGYQVGLSRRTSDNTRLTYLTTGVLLQSLITRRSLQDYTHIIVDEVHERDLDTDLLLLVLKKLMVEKEDRQTKIILMSATLNSDKFANYFPKWRCLDQVLSAGVVKIPEAHLFNVKEYYLDTVSTILGKEFLAPCYNSNAEFLDEPKIGQISYETAIKFIECFDKLERDNRNTRRGERGGVLAFLPGLMEIDTMYKMCNDYCEQKAIEHGNGADVLQWTILPLHSSITSEEQQKVFCPTLPNHRKIILATNIAESSITVTDISYVIDFCLTKSIGCDPQTNYSCLRMEWASQDQCVQRKGRVGRVSDGYVFRMLPLSLYNGLGKETIPDFEKACLENVVLCVKTLNLGCPKAILALAIDPPALTSIQNAIANLKEVGALTIETEGSYTAFDGDLTEMGRLMSKLPFDIRYSRLIALGHVFGVLEETIIIAAGLSVKSAFSYPFHKRLAAYMSKLSWSNETFSDCFAILHLYRTWFYKNTSGEFRGHSIRNWARTYFVQVNVLREMNISIQDTQRRLSNLHIEVDGRRLTSMEMSTEQGLMLKIVMAGAFYPNYFIRHRPVQREYERSISRDLAGCDPLSTIYYSGFPQEQPGDLYATHISAKFQFENSIPYVKFSGSKVLVQFDQRGAKIGPLSLDLFRGIKMRQVRHQLFFKGLRSDASYAVRDEEMKRAIDAVRIKCPPQVSLPCVTENEFLVTVTHINSPTEFWCMYTTEVDKFHEIQQALLKNAPACSTLLSTEPDSFCFTFLDSAAYRAQIDYVNESNDLLLLLVDLGISVWRKPNHCFEFNARLIHKGVHTHPCLAIKCRIPGIRPLAKYDGEWGKKTADFVGGILSTNKNIMMMHVYSVVESVIAADLFGMAEGNMQLPDQDSGLRNALLSRNLAREIDEPQPSEENRNIRVNMTTFRYVEDEVDRYNESQLSKATKPLSLRAPPEENCIHDYFLRGPFSPLEMNFKSLTLSANMKTVKIDGTSVNSVSLDQDPFSQTSRLLIAAGVGISQNSGNVIARETTLMPPIAGLVGMLTMIFCPKMQLRAERNSHVYSGCLSGLGISPVDNNSIYPDHDMEVVFDTLFDLEDINRINQIRVTMNLVLNNDGRHENYDIEHLRSVVRGELNKLLEKDRPCVEETFSSREFCWSIPKNQATKEPGEEEDDEEDEEQLKKTTPRRNNFLFVKNDVFPLHEVSAIPKDDRPSSNDYGFYH